ncbi:MAG: pilin [Patescibacteria group bacterium]|nr:pilin [Patescibacteria group bacterium]
MAKLSKKLYPYLLLVLLFGLFALPLLAATELPNPLGNNFDPRQIVANVIKAMLGIVGSIALAIFIFGGFNWITAAGNDEKIKKGKDMIMWATFGLAVIFMSYAIVTFVIGAVAGSGGNGSAIPGQGGAAIPGQGDSGI